MHCSSPGSSVHGISQARILEWVAISFSRGSSQPRDQTHIPCLASWFFTTEPPGKPLSHLLHFVWHTLGPFITLQMTQFHSSTYSIIHMYHIFFILSIFYHTYVPYLLYPVNGHLGSFNVLAIVNSAAMKHWDTCVFLHYGFTQNFCNTLVSL